MAQRIALLALVLAVMVFGAGACLFGGGDDDDEPTPTATTAASPPAATTTATAPATETPAATETPGGPRTYTVQPGDTLGAIAQQFGVTVEAIVVANGIDDPDFIDVGQVLVIPDSIPE
ncbi:MAG: hypothetical protein Kow0010_17110 [Dehalococcoidia bacterium]